MTPILPAKRPQLTRAAAEAHLKAGGVDLSKPALLGLRGYYRDTMGIVGSNDRGIYDDAICLVTPTKYLAFNGNCDPSKERPKMAVLACGLWLYKLGIHGLSKPKELQYEALVQAAQVRVIRDGHGPDTGWFGINIHRGGDYATSSLGCQTIPNPQWGEFKRETKAEMQRASVSTIPYLLIDVTGEP